VIKHVDLQNTGYFGQPASQPDISLARRRIYDGESLSEADRAFEIFKSQSRESDVLVTLMRDTDIVKQWYCHFDR
jgi:hypothetical protein